MKCKYIKRGISDRKYSLHGMEYWREGWRQSVEEDARENIGEIWAREIERMRASRKMRGCEREG